MLLLLPGATALQLAQPQVLLPACCRTHGVHHCSVGVARQGGTPALARRGLPFREPFACSHSAGAVPTKQGTWPCAEFTDSPHAPGAAGVVIRSPCVVYQDRAHLPPSSDIRLALVLKFAPAASARDTCAHLGNGMQNGEMMCCRQEKDELRLYGRCWDSYCAWYRLRMRLSLQRCAV